MRKVRKGDRVKVISGEDRGKVGKVLQVFPETDRVLVEGVNIVTKHQRPTQTVREPGIIKRESPVHVSNVKVVCPECSTPSRLGIALSDKQKLRRCKQCGATF
ncbi:MAG: LSU ribosomal protein L24p (L26e) [Candidatus Bipolaricaulis sibiricus]|uniref:Large ribosomal subunit protein uL24 n=1 Tax=Bipolaricaulis sibiricus TaxID=2501609 RepID=A0A410FTM4_BIPS1|nr:MAG: LSU ribosomal protein L24p (L26e) [Candidatus Bipolaricaulis sibiricus]